MLLDEASVTGTTLNVVAAVLAKGTTIIYNAACEPYLQQLYEARKEWVLKFPESAQIVLLLRVLSRWAEQSIPSP
ncbi:hypothetical protein MASR1M46_19950 [Bacteroidales bacterium]